MIYLAYFILAFSVIQLLVAIVNLLFPQHFTKDRTNYNELVSVLIPARNEEKNIENILCDLQNQDYQNIEIVVFNDQSTDNTEEIVKKFTNSDSRIKLINSNGLPEGWLGKNYACYSLSKHAKGIFLLFLDADVRINNDIIINTISHSVKHNLGLLSIFPKQIMMTLGERITVPNMNYILLSLLPLILVRKAKYQSLSAANGQFMLFNSKNYFDVNPHELMKANKVEDIEIARYFKKNNISIACLTGDDTIKCRMYDGFCESVNGFSKNVINFFGNSFIIAILFWIATTFGFISVYFGLKPDIFIFYFLTIIVTRVIISLASKQNILLNIILIIPQQITLGLFIYKAFQNKIKKQYQWKGRNIS
ncbi:MAG: glycosyltransferase family 2 protein [Tenuifilaceae bacterium]